MKKLIIWNECWADEFNVFGFEIVDNEEIKKVVEWLRTGPILYEFGFGSNQDLEFTTFELIHILENSKEIDEKEEDILKKLFKYNSNGTCFFDNIKERMEEEDY